MFLLNGFKQELERRLRGQSIKQLGAFVVKLVIIGAVLMILSQVFVSLFISHYQKNFTSQVLPIIELQRDIEADLVHYAMLEASIRQGAKLNELSLEVKRLEDQSDQRLLILHSLLSNHPALLTIKNRLDKLYSKLPAAIDSVYLLEVELNENKGALRGLKDEVQLLVEQLSILREGFSGKIALVDVMSKRSNKLGHHNLLNADLDLALKLSELTNNISMLMYVDNIDHLLDINSHELTQNIMLVRDAIKRIKSLGSKTLSALDLNGSADLMLERLMLIQKQISRDAVLTRLIQKDFELSEALDDVSDNLRGILASIEVVLKQMFLISNVLVSDGIEKNELISMIGSLFSLIVVVLFLFVLWQIISIITEQVNTPVTRLNNTMKRLTDGDLSARLPLGINVLIEFETVWKRFNSFVENNEKVIQEQEMIIDNADIGIAWLRNRHYVRVNNKILSMFGFTSENFVGQNSLFLYPDKDDYYSLGKEAYPLLSKGMVYTTEHRLMRSDGSVFICKLTGKSTGLGEDSDSIWLFEDVTERKLAEDKLYNLANYDALTTLPNRGLFNIYLDEAISKSRRKGTKFALFFIDLDRFKHINDSWGHEAGDIVLKEVAKRVKNIVRESDILARLGGDEFTLIVDDVQSKNGVEKVANMILGELSRVIPHQGKELFVGGSIGISFFPDNSRSRNGLLNCADSAMYVAKQAGRNGFCFYSTDIGISGEKFAELSQSLKKAVQHNEFELYYQPKIDMRTRNMVGVEALIRWNKPGVGLVSPFEFIPVLEESGLMVKVGEWVIFEACRAIKTWRELGYNPGKVAVNLSERQFGNNKLLDTVERALNEVDIPADYIEFEITESLMMKDSDLTINTLNQIKEMGIDIAMDDFGTGYSSLAYLKRYPIDILKIDRAFVKDVTDDENDAAIVEAIIAMAKQLKLKVVAEGIETEAQYEFLKECGCEVGQGYLFSKPVDFDGVLELLEKGVSLDISKQ